jgi:hypothetical protein
LKRICIAASVSSKRIATTAEMGGTATSMRRAARMTVQDGIGDCFSLDGREARRDPKVEQN